MTSVQREDDDVPYADIAKRLEAVQKAYGISQTEFMQRIGMKGHTFSGWLSGERKLKLSTMLRIRATYHVTLDYIYAGDHSGLPLRLANAIRTGKPLPKDKLYNS